MLSDSVEWDYNNLKATFKEEREEKLILRG